MINVFVSLGGFSLVLLTMVCGVGLAIFIIVDTLNNKR